ncbi:Dopey N-terminal [Trinorchestia longiramus]|nr:Dopey N-terminal [Trinorchestia longiramus]
MANFCEEESRLMGDSKYRSYVALTEKVLKAFENTSEWADLISTLSKLNKVLMSHSKFPVVPRRIIISKRLAQCMHPALPSGVHLKALETYDIIFKNIGTKRLGQELFIYSAGLFPLFVFAAMSVRSALLTIYETHFVPLGLRLRPGLNGFLSGILPGLEEGSDHLERTERLLQLIAEGVGRAEFFGSLWECIAGNGSIRLPALSHITSCYNKKLSTEDQLYILGTNLDTMVSGLCNCLVIGTVLVQRAALDLALTALPLHNSRLLLPHDTVRLVSAALLTLLRRDTSLNRRLFSWLLGLEEENSLTAHDRAEGQHRSSARADSSYFAAFSRPLLTEGILCCFRESEGRVPADLRPYKLVLCLLDRPELGQDMLDHILLDMLRCLYHSCEALKMNDQLVQESDSANMNFSAGWPGKPASCGDGSNYKHLTELNKSAGLVLGAVQPWYPWQQLVRLLHKCEGVRQQQKEGADAQHLVKSVGCSRTTFSELCTLMTHLLYSLPLDTPQQMEGAKLIDVLFVVTEFMTERVDVLAAIEINSGVNFCHKLLQKLMSAMAVAGTANTETTSNGLLMNGLPELPGQLAFKVPANDNLPQEASSNSSEDFSSASRNTLHESIDVNAYRSLLNYAVVFEKFFLSFVLKRIFSEKFSLDLFREALLQPKDRNSSSEVSRLLRECLACSENKDSCVNNEASCCHSWPHSYSDENPSRSSVFLLGDIVRLNENFLQELPAFDFACVVLIDLSSIPISSDKAHHLSSINGVRQDKAQDSCKTTTTTDTISEVTSAPFSGNNNATNDPDSTRCNRDDELPAWLLGLLACSCSGPHCTALQHSALATLCELVMIGGSEVSVWRVLALQPHSAISIVPRLLPQHVSTLQHRTLFYQEVTRSLWEELQQPHKPSQVRSVELLLRLHSITSLAPQSAAARRNKVAAARSPTCPSLVERQLLAELTRSSSCGWRRARPKDAGPQVDTGQSICPPSATASGHDAVERWLALWRLSRHCGANATARTATHTFDRCLFLMLEWLRTHQGSQSSSRQRAQAQQWLCEGLSSGDTARIIDPVLCLLLHPHTRRISVQHVTVTPLHNDQLHPMMSNKRASETAGDCSSDSLIYAISSEGGDVMYHVSKDDPNSSHSKKIFSPSAKHILALTTLMNNKLITENVQLPEYEVPYMGTNDEHHMSVLVNPFSRHPWLEMEDMSDMNKNVSVVTSESPVTELEDATEASSTTGEDEAPSIRSQVSGDNRSSPKQVVENADNLTAKQSSVENTVSWSPQQIAESIVNEILERALQECYQNQPSESESGSMDSTTDNPPPGYGSLKPSDMTLHPLHSHMLLYTQLVDSGQCLYGLTLLRNILESQPKLSLLSFASTGISALQSQSELMVLMARHKQCVLGHGFDSGDSSDIIGQYRSVMYLQAVITVCLYFIRSYYPQLPHLRLEDEHLEDNMEVQVVAVEILELIFTNLSSLVLESPRGLAPYVLDLLNKCKVQKCVLYCLLATVHAMRLPSSTINSRTNRALEAKTFTQELLDYNFRRNGERSSSAHETYLLNVMNLTVSLIKFEDALSSAKIDNSIPKKDSSTSKSHSLAHYQPGLPIPAQPMFLRVVFSALGQKHTRHLHTAWLRLFTSTLPYMGSALPTNALRTSSFLCTLLEELPRYYDNTSSSSLRPVPPDYTLTLLSSLTTIVHFCVLDQSSPSMICGAPYLGSSSKPSMSSGSAAGGATSSSHGASQMFFNILNVFTPVADALEDSLDSADQDPVIAARKALLCHLPRLVAVLLPLWFVTSSDTELNESSDRAKQYYGMETQCMAGTKSAVVQQIVAFLSPICHHHAPDFLVAISLVWQSLSETEVCKAASAGQSPTNSAEPDVAVLSKSASCQSLSQLHSDVEDRRARSLALPKKHFLKNSPCSNSLQDVNKDVLDSQLQLSQRRGSHPMNLDSLHDASGVETATSAIDLQLLSAEESEMISGSLKEQLLAVHRDRRALVGMVAAVRVLPLHIFLDTVKQVLRQPPTLHRSTQTVEVSVLEVLHCYTCSSSADQLSASWKPLISLLKEAVLALQPDALLLLLPILNNFVQRAPPILEKRQFKELQEVAGRLVESISNIAGSSLETTAWLRRNLAVKTRQDQSHAWRVSVRALEALAAEVASLLDVLYSSDEKDKVLPFLTQLMTHVTPYLRDHTVNNQRPFLAGSRLVAALSGYQYTLKAWRKDVLELLLDTNAFRMTSASLTYWKTIVDNLFTHDKSIFKEIIGRVSLSQGGSLHLFTSKEAEYASRASLLKRLAFTIFCSEPDQYSKSFPDIQERVTEVSRLGEMVPVLVGAVLNVVAVLVVRMAPRAMVSLWPVIITEMVQVFQVMEQQLLRQSYVSNQQGKRQGQDGRNNSNNNQAMQPSWLSLFLAACKLLDLLLALPAHSLPQFQMYRWAFVGSGESGCSSNGDMAVPGAAPPDSTNSDFVPHVRRISRLMALRKQNEKSGIEERYNPVSLDLTTGHLLLGGVSSISSLLDLEPFFHRLANYSSPYLLHGRSAAAPSTATQNLQNIEKQLERSFIEPLLENP